ncbi:hypothetical protein, partial [Xylella fastidiosa]
RVQCTRAFGDRSLEGHGKSNACIWFTAVRLCIAPARAGFAGCGGEKTHYDDAKPIGTTGSWLSSVATTLPLFFLDDIAMQHLPDIVHLLFQ